MNPAQSGNGTNSPACAELLRPHPRGQAATPHAKPPSSQRRDELHESREPRAGPVRPPQSSGTSADCRFVRGLHLRTRHDSRTVPWRQGCSLNFIVAEIQGEIFSANVVAGGAQTTGMSEATITTRPRDSLARPRHRHLPDTGQRDTHHQARGRRRIGGLCGAQRDSTLRLSTDRRIPARLAITLKSSASCEISTVMPLSRKRPQSPRHRSCHPLRRT